MEYIDLSTLLTNNFAIPNENQNCIWVDNG